ncbi:hypothetical protein ACXDF8_04645 [Mycolicibacterium sp. CBM1]
MSEALVPPGALDTVAAPPQRRLRGTQGVASVMVMVMVMVMVVAAAAPLGVIGSVVPLGIALGNGPGFPATFVVSTVVLLLFSVGFTAMTPYVDEAGAFFSYVRTSLGFPVAQRCRGGCSRQRRSRSPPTSATAASSCPAGYWRSC